MTRSIFLLLVNISFSSALAGDCILSIDRKACLGKEINALKPYNGKNPTESKKTAKDPEECTRLALRESKIIRIGDLKEKIVTPKFNGKTLDNVSDQKACK